MKRSETAFAALMMLIALLIMACSSCSKKPLDMEKQKGTPKIGITRENVEVEPFDEKYARLETYQEAKDQSSNYYLSSKTCRKCHDSIYGNWKNSMHSMAYADPVFEAAYYKSYRLIGRGASTFCLKCHAPIGSVDPDYNLNDEVVREGVGCDFCHSIKKVDLNTKEKFVLAADDTKMGPHKGAESPFHKCQYSPLHKKAELCGGCHNLINENGVEVMGTYNEWKKSGFPEKGVQCQNCHMPLIENSRTVNERVAANSRKAYSHMLVGGHSEEQLKKAIEVKIVNIVRKSDGTDVYVKVTNKGAGHKIPTGTPSRRLVLKVIVTSYENDEEITHATREYRKILVGKSHETLRDDAEMILLAYSIASDNRIAPGETREELFKFPISPSVNIRVEAELTYHYDPVVFTTENMRVLMGFDSSVSMK